jgi:hypothetical protein
VGDHDIGAAPDPADMQALWRRVEALFCWAARARDMKWKKAPVSIHISAFWPLMVTGTLARTPCIVTGNLATGPYWHSAWAAPAPKAAPAKAINAQNERRQIWGKSLTPHPIRG